jgi:hypothetical protein
MSAALGLLAQGHAQPPIKIDQPKKRLFLFIFICSMHACGCDGEGFPDFDAVSILRRGVCFLSSCWVGAAAKKVERSDRGCSKSTSERDSKKSKYRMKKLT